MTTLTKPLNIVLSYIAETLAPTRKLDLTSLATNIRPIRPTGKDNWPSVSLDLNPLAYSIWESLSEKVYVRRSRTTRDSPSLESCL